MADIIQLLPDSIANQIAAGEVIQRPASVVKELVENAIDAGSTEVRLVVKEAGKLLVQVTDNGSGMSETDARMCFERHATSKIRTADDLFAIRTMGFRGEAMASIAAVAQVELKTRQSDKVLGSQVFIEGSVVQRVESCQAAEGTTISVKNLFFNVPARRNFLKSNAVEMRHILEEFQRIALAHPQVFFTVHHNSAEVFHLPSGNLRQRIVGIFGAGYNAKLVPIQEETQAVSLGGFVGKPEFSKKTRGEQFFFVNNRFIKSTYLHHAVMAAYEDLMPKDAFPFYTVFIEIDPARIDINVHPTKQEIKFEDEKLIYNYLKVSIRHALGQYSIIPTLDFEQMPAITGLSLGGNRVVAGAKSSRSEKGDQSPPSFDPDMQADRRRQKDNLANWQRLYDGLSDFEQNPPQGDAAVSPVETADGEPVTTLILQSNWEADEPTDDNGLAAAAFIAPAFKEPYQIHGAYIVSHIKSGFLLIDQQRAHERVLYEKYLGILTNRQAATQQELFPETIQFSPADAELLRGLLDEVRALGFGIETFGATTFVVKGVPAELKEHRLGQTMERLLEQFKTGAALSTSPKERLAKALARQTAIKHGTELTATEMQHLTDSLFACDSPLMGIDGKACLVTFDLDDLRRRFDIG